MVALTVRGIWKGIILKRENNRFVLHLKRKREKYMLFHLSLSLHRLEHLHRSHHWSDSRVFKRRPINKQFSIGSFHGREGYHWVFTRFHTPNTITLQTTATYSLVSGKLMVLKWQSIWPLIYHPSSQTSHKNLSVMSENLALWVFSEQVFPSCNFPIFGIFPFPCFSQFFFILKGFKATQYTILNYFWFF